MKIKFKQHSKRFYLIIIIICIIVFVFFVKRKTVFDFLSSFISDLQKNVSKSVFYVRDSFTVPGYVKDSNKFIKEINEKYAYLVNENQILKAENDRLKRLLKLTDNNKVKKFTKCYANVIGANENGFIFNYLIDKGQKDGLEIGDGVVSDEGVTGVVQKVFPETSLVLLLTDVKCRIPVRVERNKKAGILIGKGYNLCELEYISKEEDISVGDVLVTSGLSASFPEGLLVGKIISADKKAEKLTMDILVKPFVNVSRIQEVFVVSKHQK
jgi:rod shape-determining protein MreC